MFYSPPVTRTPLASLVAALALGAVSPAAAQTPPATSRRVDFTDLRVVPSSASNMVYHFVTLSRARFAACAPATAHGGVALRLATRGGEVSTATIRGTDFDGPEQPIADCVLNVARALRFPGWAEGTLDIEFMVILPGPRPARRAR